MKQEVKDQKIEMKQEGMMVPQIMGNDFGKSPMLARELGGFLRTPLTKEEQDAVVALLRAQQLERDVIMADVSLTMEAKATKIRELTSTHMTALLVYISTDKQDLFKKIMEERMSMMAKKPEVRKEFKEEIKQQKQEFKEGVKEKKQEFKKEVQAKKQALSEKNKAILTKAVTALSLERLQAILAKVEKALTVAKKERVIDQLNEIGDMLQSKIDELTGASSEEDVLWDILGTTDTTTAGTGTTTVTQ
ncbi:MAG: hypothetical protein ACD_71C00049G0001 [uncultured bacterium (gcode 4)]|uniref:Uncharacterized protein n=1 Tax=uncultured bacterium (gcode 4) TaxID=1234023 RepID=K1Z658_9BACT|nr:MAG: hypothetical protein ACD_71C00049G0001 [uncultured bacterium (gcode 4)]